MNKIEQEEPHVTIIIWFNSKIRVAIKNLHDNQLKIIIDYFKYFTYWDWLCYRITDHWVFRVEDYD